MTYQNERNGNGGIISIHTENQQEIGRCTYTILPEESILIISYVLVHKPFEGKGVGKFLVQSAIHFAKENNWKVSPHCSYARSVMKRMTNIEDILV